MIGRNNKKYLFLSFDELQYFAQEYVIINLE